MNLRQESSSQLRKATLFSTSCATTCHPIAATFLVLLLNEEFVVPILRTLSEVLISDFADPITTEPPPWETQNLPGIAPLSLAKLIVLFSHPTIKLLEV